MEIDLTQREVGKLRAYKYLNRKAEDTIRRMGSRTGLIIEGTILRSLQQQGFDLNPERDNKSVYEPEKIWDALEAYAQRKAFYPRKDALDVAYRKTLKAFGGKHGMRPMTDYLMLQYSVKGEKASGAPEFTKKREAFEMDYQRAMRIANDEGNPHPCVAYHRVQHGSEGPKTRLVWGYPQSMTILEAMFARPLIDHFLNVNSPMAFGKYRVQLAAALVPIRNGGVVYGLDFSKFDSTLQPKLLSMAFKILRTHFNLSDEEQLIWEKVINYFIHTPILMPDGYVYRKHTGVPSGSYFTQLVDSICNYLAIQYAMIILYGEAVFEDKILVLGDDSLFSVPKYLPPNVISSVLGELGLVVNPDKTGVYVNGQDPDFLGHTWEHGIVNREPSEVAKRMAFPEVIEQGKEDPRQRIRRRMASYLSDSKVAWKIFEQWSFYSGPKVKGNFDHGREPPRSLGWHELQEMLGQPLPDKSIYSGILL